MEKLNFVVIYGSYRRERKGIRPAKFVVKKLAERASVQFVDAKEVDLPMLDLRYFEYAEGAAPANLENAAKTLREADGFVIVTGEYNRGLPPGLSNFLDHFTVEFRNKPVAMVSYSSGAYGGVRAAENLRAVVANLGMICLPLYHPFPVIGTAFGEDGEPTDEATVARFEKFLDKWMPFARVIAEANSAGKFG